MFEPKYVPTKHLLEALIQAKRSFGRNERTDSVPPTVRSSREDVSPFTLREGLFYEDR